MINLKEIGFKSFEDLDKTKRDGVERMVWTGVYKDELVGIQIAKLKNDKWILDKVLFNSKKEEIIAVYFNDGKNLDIVLKFIAILKNKII